MVPLVLTLALDGGKWSTFHPPSGGKRTQYPLDRRLGGLQRQSGCHGEEKN
jgi:hypothetical protein